MVDCENILATDYTDWHTFFRQLVKFVAKEVWAEEISLEANQLSAENEAAAGSSSRI